MTETCGDNGCDEDGEDEDDDGGGGRIISLIVVGRRGLLCGPGFPAMGPASINILIINNKSINIYSTEVLNLETKEMTQT